MEPFDSNTPPLRIVRSPKAGKSGHKRLLDLFRDGDAPELKAVLADRPDVAELLAGIAEGSPYLWRLISRFSEDVVEFLSVGPSVMIPKVIAGAMALGEASSQAAIMSGLRRAKYKAALAIGLADLGGDYDTVAVTHALADFADATVQAALRFALREAERAGKFMPADAGVPEQDLGFFILALGKHGARELNYSSDIDLTIFYDPECPGLASAADPHGLATGIVKTIVKLLNERTADGYVQRVDLRLRPDPGTTPIAMPVLAALNYYETVGQNWERAAMIKARVVAGDVQAGNAFIKELSPFIWRKYFDYAAIADIHAMKRQIYAVKGHDQIAVPGHDLKVGRGGIREIEFFVQTQQLVYGGRRPGLRGSRTLDMLGELERESWITPEARQELTQAYMFLRDLEHRVQMQNDEQTQKLPKSDEDMKVFAAFSGFTRAAFDKALVKEMRVVERHYARLFEGGPDLASKSGSLVFTGVVDDPATIETLRRLGFQKPELVAETVRGWHFGRRPAVTTPRAREILTELVPGLLEAFGQSSDPDGALLALDNALQRLPAAIELFAILKENKGLRRLFAECLGTAPRLSEIVSRSPHVLDVLVDPDFAQPTGGSGICGRIIPRLERETEFEAFLDRARELAHAERFLLGTRILSRVMPLSEAGLAHTLIAETFLGQVLARVRREFADKHGALPGAELVVVGYGKAGSREMTATSDLDLVVVYDADPDAMSEGARPLMTAEYFSRLTQRLVTALSTQMRTGTLYEIDLRLRPSGRKGTVATSLAGFRDYQTTEAETWEHMALSRARVLAGDAALAERLTATIADILGAPRDPAKTCKEVAQMRGLMNREKPGRDVFDVKDWPGGLVDCEFVGQALVLCSAPENLPGLLGLPTSELLAKLAVQGALSPDDHEEIAEAYRIQTAFMQATRICLPTSFAEKETSQIFRQRLAGLLDYPDFAMLKADLTTRQKRIRALFEKIVGKVG